MKMKVFLAVLLICLADVSSQLEWSYSYQTQWPGACKTGKQQSPINIMSRQAVFDKEEGHIHGPLVLRGYRDVTVTSVNNGHTLRWDAVPDLVAPVMSGGPLSGNYTFMQFHLHWLSEHAIDGMKYPLEIHMVHMKTGLTVDEAVLRPDGLAVIGVMCEIYSKNEESEHALEEIMPAVPGLIDPQARMAEPTSIDLTRLLSPDPQSYYTYHGSLTTPLCQEAVTWIVMDKPITISDDQYQEITKADVGGRDNYRSLQPVNRVVYRSLASCSSIIAPSLIGTLFAIVHCLSSTFGAGVNKGICLIGNFKRRLFGDSVKQCAKL
ncbi:carbonic anhydrase [Manduca sexta]|uniref:carbonic anhydrase n=1 Tax=Manduca sexta TaxID=7130 RepID=UPI001182F545|nr:carbonic anhydrase [Manduca sexta]